MTCLVISTTTAVGILIYRQATDASLVLALQSLEANTGLIAGELEGYVAAPDADAAALTRAPSVRSFAALPPQPDDPQARRSADEVKARIGQEFIAFLEAKPQYDQIRLIGRAGNGKEVVRADRRGQGSSIRLVEPSGLQSKADRPYFAATLSLGTDRTYVSSIDYNREAGAIEDPMVPTTRVAKPVSPVSGAPQYFVILNLDMRPIFRRISGKAFSAGEVYLVDTQGNYLLNSQDPERVFGFESGQDFTIRADWPGIDPLLHKTSAAVAELTDKDGASVAVAASPIEIGGSRRMTLVQIAPTTMLLADTNAIIAKSSAIVVGVAAVIAVLLSLLLTSNILRPIRLLTSAVNESRDSHPARLPKPGFGEVGALTTAIAHYMDREALLRALINSSVDAILTKNLDGTITSWNPAAEQLYGYSAAEAVGSTLDLIVPADYRRELQDIMEKIRSDQRIGPFQTVRVNKAGERLDISLTISPLRNAAGAVVGASTIARDITQTLADARRLKVLQAEAAHSSRITAAGQMAATLAHELNQPLTAVINYLKSALKLLDDEGIDEASKAILYTRKAIEQSSRAGEIVRRVRNFIGNRQTVVTRQPLNDIVEEGLSLVLLGREENRVKVKREYMDGLPDVYVDRVHIQQIVANLARNAIEAMASVRNGVLTVGTRMVGEHLVVSFHDTGAGIAPAIRNRVFEPFTTTKQSGMGFGLNISRSLVEAHGGRLTVENLPTGALFEFTLPAAQAEAA